MNDAFSIDQISSDSLDEKYDGIKLNQSLLKKEIKASAFYQRKLLNSYLKAWNFYIAHRKFILENEMKFIRWKIFQIQKIFFRKLLKNYDVYLKFHGLKPKLMIIKHFLLWTKFIEIQQNIKLCYCELVTERRHIYQKCYLKKWHRALSLKHQYNYYSKHENQVLGQKALKAFHTYIVKKRNYEKIVSRLQLLNLHGIFIQWCNKWRYARMTRYIQRKNNLYIRYEYFLVWYDSMKSTIRLRRKFRYVNNYHKSLLIQKCFDFWFRKYYQINDIKQKFHDVQCNSKIHLERIVFDRFLLEYNNKQSLMQNEKKLLIKIEGISKKYYLDCWISKMYYNRMYSQSTSKTIKRLNFFKLNYAFQIWKRKHCILCHYQTQFAKVVISHKRIILRRYLLKWFSEYKCSYSNRDLLQRAHQFRSISLELKVFYAFSLNVKMTKLRKRQKVKLALARKKFYFLKWKKLYIKYRRRFILISSALKAWSITVEKKMFTRWVKYIQIQKKKAMEYALAQKAFHEHEIAVVIQSFIQGCKVLTAENCKKPVEKELSDVSIDDLPDENDVDTGMSPKVEFHDQSVMPSYENDNVYNPTNDLLTTLGKSFNDLAKKYRNGESNEENRIKLLSLIQQMNKVQLEANI